MAIPGLDDAASVLEMRERQIRLARRLQTLGLRALEELEAKRQLNLSSDDAKALINAGKAMATALGDDPERIDDAPENKPN